MNSDPPITLNNDENDNAMEMEDTTVLYNFSIHHPSYVDTNYVLESIESSARLFFNSVLSESNNLIRGLEGEEGEIEMIKIEATTVRIIREDNEEKSKLCGIPLESDDNITCTLLNLAATVSYPKTITDEDVRFQMLLYQNEMTNIMSNTLITVKYKGRIPSNCTTTFYLAGNEDLATLTQGTLSFLESTIKVFLNNIFALSSVKIRRVRVLHQQVQNHERHLLLRSVMKTDRVLVTNTLAVKTSILGEFTPPPYLDLGDLIDEIYKESGMSFLEVIQQNKLLQNIHSINSISHTHHVIPAQTAPEHETGTGHNIFQVKEFSIPFFVMLSFIIVFLFVYVVNMITKKKAVVKVLGMEELMERRGSSRSALETTDGVLSATKGQKSYKSLQLKSDERVYSVTNLQ